MQIVPYSFIFQTPIFVPIIVLVVSIYLVVAPIIQTGRTTFLYAVIFMFCGLVVYFPFIHWKLRFPYTGKFVETLHCCKRLTESVRQPFR